MSGWRLAKTLFLLWLCVSVAGLLAPLWALGALCYLTLQRRRERSFARRLATLLERTQGGNSWELSTVSLIGDR